MAIPTAQPTPDGLQPPRRDMRHGPNVYRLQPPVVGDVCKGVATKNANADCAYQSALCAGDPNWCPRCRFPYCAHHYSKHVYQLVAPQDIWAQFAKRLEFWKKRVGNDPSARPRVVPDFPDEDPEALL